MRVSVRAFSMMALVGLVAVVTGLTAQAQELTVIAGWSGVEQDQFMPVLEAFQKETGIKVNYRVYRAEDLSQVLPAQFGAGRTIGDVIFTSFGWWIRENSRHMVDLSDVAAGVPFNIDVIRVQDAVYGVPYVVSVKPGFWYRKSFFQKHGLQQPNSWDEFTALLDRTQKVPGVKNAIASGDGVGWPLSDVTEHFLAAFGGKALNLDLIAGQARWGQDPARSILETRLVPLLQKKYFSDPIEWTQALQLWWKGDYGLYFMGNWVTGMVDDPTDLGVFPLPGATAVVGGSDYIFVPRYSRDVEAAKRLVAFMVSNKGVQIRVAQGGKLSMRSDVGPEHYPPADRALAEALQGFTIIPDMDDTIGGAWQQTFWDQLKLLWVRPSALNDVLRTLDEKR